MTNEELREEIRQGLRVVWCTFKAGHPELADVIDFDLAVDKAHERFQDDPDFAHAIADALARRVGAMEMTRRIRKLLRKWLDLILQ